MIRAYDDNGNVVDLVEYEKKINECVINKFVVHAIKEFQKFDDEIGIPTLSDICVILCDVAGQLKGVE